MTARRAIAAIFFVDGALFASWASRIPALSSRVHASTGVLGLVLLAPALGAVIAMPRVGGLMAGRSSRAFCQAAVAALMVAIVLPGIAVNVPELAAALLLAGVANSSLDVAMNAHGVTVERHLRRPVLSSLHAAFAFGGFAGAGLGALAAALSVAPPGHLAFAALLFGVPGLLLSRRLLPFDEDEDAYAPRLRLIRLPARLLLLGIACFCSFIAEGGAGDWSAKLVRDELGGSAALGALAFASFSVAMGVGRLFSDVVWARWGAVTLLRRSGLLAGLGFAAGLAWGGAAAAVLGFAALGLGLSSVVPVLFRAAAEQPGVSTAPALATVSSLAYTGFLAGPPIVGGLAQATSLRFASSLFVLAALMVFALAPIVRLPAATRPVPQPATGR